MVRRAALVLPITLALSCSGLEERPVHVGMAVSVPQILLSRLDDQLHLRIFSAGDLGCNTMTGQIVRGTTHVTDAYAGHNVNPTIRCDATMWNAQMTMFGGVASPADVCFSQAQARQTIPVPAGTYLVLVEGSGAVTGPGGMTQHILLGSGCAAVTAAAGANLTVQIEMREQANVGVCGDGMVQGNESCDPGGTPSPLCDNLCQFTEQQANGALLMSPPHNPSVGWADGQQLVVGFEADDHVWVHQFDANAAAITSIASLANDNNPIDAPMTRFQQANLRVHGYPTGFTASWQTNARTVTDEDVGGTMTDSYLVPPPPTPSVMANPTSNQAMHNRARGDMAAGASRVVFVFEDDATNTIRTSNTAATLPLTAPARDVPLVASGVGMANGLQPSIVATASGFIATWTAGTVGTRNIFAARLDATGAAMGAAVQVNTTIGNDQDLPSISARNSDVAIAWRDGSGAQKTIRWRSFDTSLTPMGMDRLAPSTTGGDLTAPAIAVAPNHVVLVVWESADGTIRGRMFHPDGSTVVNRINTTDQDFIVNAGATEMPRGTGPRHNPAVAFGGAQLFGVAWEDAGTGTIQMRTLRAD